MIPKQAVVYLTKREAKAALTAIQEKMDRENRNHQRTSMYPALLRAEATIRAAIK